MTGAAAAADPPQPATPRAANAGPVVGVDAIWSAYQHRWESTATYTATFNQSIEIDGIGGDVDSGGSFYFARPDRMRFDYTRGQEQRVVGDGSWIWVYQPDLEQVYKVDYATAFGSGGLVALLGDREGLAERYELSLLDSTEGMVRLRLDPKAEVGETLELVMSADTFDLRSVVMTDPAGSVTRVEFEEVHRNVELKDGLFAFSPPAGVDVITAAPDGS
jgi:chaperone LolA